ncbi:MAG: hypothetical protein ACOCQG_00020 [Candidatus Nanoarchaeia archaeon]
MTIIKKPEDATLVNRLEKKLNEYKGRIDKKQEKSPQTPYNELLNTGSGYKAMILGNVLFNERADTDRLYKNLESKMGGIDKIAYNNAVGVINDYINNEGRNTIGGTGY